MKHPKKEINVNTDALINRAVLNNNKSKIDLDEWIIETVQFKEGMHVLDLGCGSGKQIFKVLPYVGKSGSITGYDLSEKAALIVREEAAKKQANNVSAIQGDLDEVLDKLNGKSFDRIISTYAIYYSKDLVNLLKGLEKLLKPGGKLFVCGYGKDSNQEAINKSNELLANIGTPIKHIENFISEEEIKKVSEKYSDFKIYSLSNYVSFYSTEDFLKWWKSHAMYNHTIEKDLTSWLNEFFKNNNEFRLTKNVFAIEFS